ncbi:MAG TPA: hypothetical protein VNN77_10190 [candidate division Zixibacteria bacterium]|nr:hypothetical protein [candidate division Zixibacteria bacterium]
MQFCRLYTGPDGRSHFEDLDGAPGFFSTPHRVKALVFRKEHNPNILGWHNAPRRQWCITLSGSVTIGVGDGTQRTFTAGDVFLAEDLTGEGHTALPQNWVRAFVHLE